MTIGQRTKSADASANRIANAAIAALAIVACTTVLYATRWGPSAGTDSVSYIDVGRNLAGGRGLVEVQASGDIVPLGLRPPMYPILLAAAGILGLDFMVWARALDAVLFLLFLLSLGLAASRLCGKPILGALLCLSVLSWPAMLGNFTSAMSEPLFFTLGAATIILGVWYTEVRRPGLLIAAGILGGAAWLTRYVGLAFILSVMLVLAVDHRRPFRDRARAILVYAGLSISPFLLWSLNTILRGGALGTMDTVRVGLWDALEPVRNALVHMAWALLPTAQLPEYPYRVKLAALSVGALLILAPSLSRAFREHRQAHWSTLSDSTFLLTIAFAGLAIFSTLILGATYVAIEFPKPALDERVLSPVFLGAGVASLMSLFYAWDGRRGGRLVWIVPVGLTLVFLWGHLPASRALVDLLHNEGQGYSSRAWLESGVIRAVQGLPADIALVSNDADAILLFAGRAAYRMTELESRTPVQYFSRYGDDQTDPIQRLFRERQAALVLFDGAYWQFEPIYGEDTSLKLESLTAGLVLYTENWDGAIYFFPGQEP